MMGGGCWIGKWIGLYEEEGITFLLSLVCQTTPTLLCSLNISLPTTSSRGYPTPRINDNAKKEVGFRWAI
jgi:hypothetical protein